MSKASSRKKDNSEQNRGASKRPTKKEARRKSNYRFKKAREVKIYVGKQCTKVTKCKKLSCYYCRAKNQRTFTRARYRSLEAALSRDPGNWAFLTIVPSFGRTEVGSEPKGGLRKFNDKVARQMRAVDPNLSAVCYVDVSLNIGLDGSQYWQWHVHAVVTKLQDPARACLRKAFKGNWCRKPVMIKKIYDVTGLLEYISKPDLFLREDVRDEMTGKKGTRTRSMPVRDELRLMSVLSQWRVTQRNFEIRDPLKNIKSLSS